MGIIKVINSDGRVEHISEVELQHRTDVRRMTVGEVPSAKPAVQVKEPVSAKEDAIPAMLGKVKKCTTLAELQAISDKESRPQVLAAIKTRMQEIEAGEGAKAPPADQVKAPATPAAHGAKKAEPAPKKTTTKKQPIKA